MQDKELLKYPPILRKDDAITRLILRKRYDLARYKNSSCFDSVNGDMGSGKSYWSLYMGYVLDRTPEGELQFDVEKSIVFDPKELINRIWHPDHPGQFIVFEESGVSVNAKEALSLTSRIMEKVMSTARSRNQLYAWNSPHHDQTPAKIKEIQNGMFEFLGVYNRYSKFKYYNIRFPKKSKAAGARLNRMRYEFVKEYKTVDENSGLKVLVKYSSFKFSLPKHDRTWRNIVKRYEQRKQDYIDTKLCEMHGQLEGKDKEEDKPKKMTFKEMVNVLESKADMFLTKDNKLPIVAIMDYFNCSKTRAEQVIREYRKLHSYDFLKRVG